MAWSFLTAVKGARADAVTAQIGIGAHLAIWTAAYALKLAEWTWTGNVFAPSGGANNIAMLAPATNPVTPGNPGVAAIGRVGNAAGTVFYISDLTVGTSGTDIIISNTTIQTNVPVSLNSFTLTEAP